MTDGESNEATGSRTGRQETILRDGVLGGELAIR